MSTKIETVESVAGENEKPGWLVIVRRQVESLSYGVVQIVVHDSQVTQIEKTERVRLDGQKKNLRPARNPEAQSNKESNL
jgi:hypothetical protein